MRPASHEIFGGAGFCAHQELRATACLYEQMARRDRLLVIIGAVFLGSGCVAAPETTPISGGPPARDDSPVQTDSLVYHLQRLPSEYRAHVIASFTNRTGSPVYFARCSRNSATPMFGIRRTGVDSTKRLFSDFVWACVGGVPTGEIAPGGTTSVRVPVGSVDQSAMQPPLQPQQLVGLMRVTLVLCRKYSGDSDNCDAVSDAQRRSNAFLVTY